MNRSGRFLWNLAATVAVYLRHPNLTKESESEVVEEPKAIGVPDEKQNRWEAIGVTGVALGSVVLSLAVAVGAQLVHNHFGPKAAICNTFGGTIAQQSDTGILAGCGISEFLSQMSTIIQWLGYGSAAFFAILVVLGMIGTTKNSQN